MNKKKLIREQLEISLQRLAPLQSVNTPQKGWVRAIRNALGMTAKQLARRLAITQQAVARIEKDELSGSVAIKTMRRVAEGLDCIFVCGFVPRVSLEATLRKQAQKIAAIRLVKASQTMSMEDQALSQKENQKVLSEMLDELIDKLPSNLWDR